MFSWWFHAMFRNCCLSWLSPRWCFCCSSFTIFCSAFQELLFCIVIYVKLLFGTIGQLCSATVAFPEVLVILLLKTCDPFQRATQVVFIFYLPFTGGPSITGILCLCVSGLIQVVCFVNDWSSSLLSMPLEGICFVTVAFLGSFTYILRL